jgi:hypothetical protein
MSAVQAGGGKGSGQRSGTAAGGRPPAGTKPASATRGANGAGKPAPGRRPAPATKTGSGGAGGGGKGPKQPGGYKPGAKPPQRFSPSTLAFVAIAVVVVIIVAFVVIKVTGKSTPSATSTQLAPTNTPAPASLVAQVTGVPTSVATSVGLPPTSTVAVPAVKTGQPKLTIGGKPAAVFIGAEFCPYCAAERWSMIMAFSKFGTFSNLQETTSSPWDTYPSTATFSFLGATYTSNYLTAQFVEHESNDTSSAGGRATLEPLTNLQQTLWSRYDSPVGYPFLDIGNKVFITTPSYLPSTLAGMDQSDIAARLTNPKDAVTEAIVGTANYMTAGICAITGQQPPAACSPTVIGKAAKAMGLS